MEPFPHGLRLPKKAGDLSARSMIQFPKLPNWYAETDLLNGQFQPEGKLAPSEMESL
ncbi:hypothetical protein [Lyngbya sp. CCY1209]|uniref:hypothetical protein n=1 Tax=Lyngbya sp. CCY1209 TaxID=2886103 RepID=UPI002D212EB8|nr:hypothetical protein [Lyngbya sp. CCY1209]MEB3886925.1 hypothetical protein [Lyngbya sp. CCY1209]